MGSQTSKGFLFSFFLAIICVVPLALIYHNIKLISKGKCFRQLIHHHGKPIKIINTSWQTLNLHVFPQCHSWGQGGCGKCHPKGRLLLKWWFSKWGPWAVRSASSENLLEMHISWPTLDSQSEKLWGQDPAIWLNKPQVTLAHSGFPSTVPSCRQCWYGGAGTRFFTT